MAEKFAPLSQTQLGIYFDCLNMSATAYNIHSLIELDAAVDMNRLAAAIEKVVAARRGLHVRIFEREGEPYQKIVAENYAQDILKLSEAAWQKNSRK